jgi:glycosyltransferase involved in cell wall biosynthesis
MESAEDRTLTKAVLFISHDASRTGAPIIFLNFLRWFKENTSIPFKILLRNGGSLESEFLALAPVLVLNQQHSKTLSQKFLSRLGIHQSSNSLQYFLGDEAIGLIYSNTVTNHEVLNNLTGLECPVISHVHELEYWIYRTGINNFNATRTLTSHFIACSDAVKDNLINNHDISSDSISTVHAFVPIKTLQLEAALKECKEIRNQLKIPQDAFIVGASGTVDWRKGPDLFVQLARTVHSQQPNTPIYFLWIGGNDSLSFFELQYDITKLGLEHYIRFLGSKPNPLDYFAAFDAFALVSRDDPYPLVCLEAASLGKPILCFDQAGGEREFVEDDCGFVVPYLNIETMAAKILALMNSPELCHKLGENAKRKVQARHNVQLASSQIFEIISHFLIK